MKKRMLIGVDGATASKLQSGANIFSYGSQGISAIVETISKVQDKKKRRQFESSLASLSTGQQEKLNKQLIDARSDAERLAILTDSLTSMQIGRISRLSDEAILREQKRRWNTILYVSAGMVFAGVMVVYLARSK